MKIKSLACKISWLEFFKSSLFILICGIGYTVLGSQAMTQGEIKSLLADAVKYTTNATFKSNNFMEDGIGLPTDVIYYDAQRIRFEITAIP